MIPAAFYERIRRDPVPARLGHLASALSRVASLASLEPQDAAVPSTLDECRRIIECAGPEADPDLQPGLVELQVELARWRLRWARPLGPEERRELSRRATQESGRMLEASGLLDRR